MPTSDGASVSLAIINMVVHMEGCVLAYRTHGIVCCRQGLRGNSSPGLGGVPRRWPRSGDR